MTVVAAALAALAVLLAWPRSARRRLASITQATNDATQNDATRADADQGGRVLTVVGIAGALGVGLLVGGVVGIVIGVALAGVVTWLLRRSSDATDDDDLRRVVPQVADLLAATLSSGAALPAAIAATADALDDDAGTALRRVHASLELGADVAEAWRRAGPAFASIGTAFVRSAGSGAPLANVLTALADDTRRERRLLVEVAARSAGVKAVAPLVACFLPAFVLVGVVPVVVSIAGDLIAPH